MVTKTGKSYKWNDVSHIAFTKGEVYEEWTNERVIFLKDDDGDIRQELDIDFLLRHNWIVPTEKPKLENK